MNFSARLLRYPRVTIAAFLTLLAFIVPAVIQTVVADAAPAASAAKKKKCKKGYKKNKKGKCKKKTSSTNPKVTEVNVQLAVSNKGQVKVNGQFKTNSPNSSTFAGEVAVTVAGTTQKVTEQFATRHSNIGQFSKLVTTNFADTDGGTVTVTVGGVTSAPATIK